MYSKQVAILMDCLDHLAEKPDTGNTAACYEFFQQIIDKLGSYPKPSDKGDTHKVPANVMCAYLYTSNARNSCKLAQLKVFASYTVAFDIVRSELEAALSVLVD